jgi:hypothetical protein
VIAPAGSEPEGPLFTPEQRRRNIILGSLLGLLVIVMIVSEIAMFQANGFPKDPDEWDRLQHRSTNADGSVPQPSQNQNSAPSGKQPGAPAQGSR